MDKEDFMMILKSKGYKCVYENNMPIVLVRSRDEISDNLIKIEKIVANCGYDYSWGIKVEQDGNTDI